MLYGSVSPPPSHVGCSVVLRLHLVCIAVSLTFSACRFLTSSWCHNGWWSVSEFFFFFCFVFCFFFVVPRATFKKLLSRQIREIFTHGLTIYLFPFLPLRNCWHLKIIYGRARFFFSFHVLHFIHGRFYIFKIIFQGKNRKGKRVISCYSMSYFIVCRCTYADCIEEIVGRCAKNVVAYTDSINLYMYIYKCFCPLESSYFPLYTSRYTQCSNFTRENETLRLYFKYRTQLEAK